jgi:hypothetical protein
MALFRLGQEAARRREWQRAARLFGQAAEREPGNPTCHLAVAQVLQLGERPAASAFQRVLSLDPDCLEAHWGMGIECTRAGNHAEALRWLQRYIETKVRRGQRTLRPPPQQRTEIPSTTLVCVDCKHYGLAADAIMRTLEQCKFARALFVTDADVRIDGVEVLRIPPIRSLAEYSRFIAKELDRHVQSDFVLVMQWDGYVLSGQQWRPEFQQFDYVGAPWAGPEGLSVGNGGFSLRSKRLLKALQDPEISDLSSEDIAICRTYRPMLESRYGIRFATPDIASSFSFETLTPPGPTFGFHGVVHLAQILDMTDAQLAEFRPAPSITFMS